MKLLKQMMVWAALLVFSVCASAQNPSPRNVATGRGGRNLPLHGSAEFYQSAEARRIADQVLLYQRVTGGWPKNINMSRPLSDDERAKVLKDKERRDDSTTDNGTPKPASASCGTCCAIKALFVERLQGVFGFDGDLALV